MRLPRRVSAIAAGQAEVIHAAAAVSAAGHPGSADRQAGRMHALPLHCEPHPVAANWRLNASMHRISI